MLSPLTSNPVPLPWVEKLFSKFTAMYGNRFLDMWRGLDMQEVKQLWAEQLAGLTGEEIRTGIQALISKDFPPSLPEFMALCRPKLDALAAYYEAVKGVVERERGEVGTWTHPAIFWASVAVGAFDLKSQSYSQIRTRWESALEAELKKGTWAEIPAPMPALPAPTRREADRENAARTLSGLKDMNSKADHKAWAKKILQRVANGEKPPLVAVQMAKDALEAKETHE